ncbi:MAG: hypothetical protein ABJA60_08120 [Nitrosospira sp.]
MGKERAGLNLNEDIDLTAFAPKIRPRPKSEEENHAIKQAAEQSGFTSREPKMRRRKPSSPYKIQLNLKVRDGIKELFQDVGERLNVHDKTAFEKALLALIEKEQQTDLLQRYSDIVK